MRTVIRGEDTVSPQPSGDEELEISDQEKAIDTKFMLIIYCFEPRELRLNYAYGEERQLAL